MDILGYLGYALLILIAIYWTICVRLQLGAWTGSIFQALFYVACAILLGVCGINKLHSWWVIPCGAIINVRIIPTLYRYVPAVFYLIELISSAFAAIVRIGIPTSRIRAAQEAAWKDTVERAFSRRDEDE